MGDSRSLLRLTGSLGLLVAVATLLFVAFETPDGGFDAWRSGIAIAAVLASVPMAVLWHSPEPSRVVSLGGAMTVAGAATMVGGNLFGVILATAGLPILLVGASRQPPLEMTLVVRVIGYALPLGIAMWLALDASLLSLVAVVVLAGAVATSPGWDKWRSQEAAS